MVPMHFRRCSIVRFALKEPFTAGISVGKVTKVTGNEVVIIPQVLIELPDENGEYSPNLSQKVIDRYRSVDAHEAFHLDRELIAGWEYERIDLLSMYIDSETIRYGDISYQYVNQYDGDGYYKGKGKYFE